jgi:IS30 family transposase
MKRRPSVARARGDAVFLSAQHRHIKKLTREIREIDRRAGRQDAEARVEIGQRLAEVRARLEHGDWPTPPPS